jgi:hypothetical protein
MVVTAVILDGIGDYTCFGVTSVGLPLGTGWMAVILCGVAGGLLGSCFSRILITAARGLPGASRHLD